MSYKHLLVGMSAILVVTGMAAAEGPVIETGKFYLFLQGQHFGSETYQIRKEENDKTTTTSETEMAMLEADSQNRLTFTSRQVLDSKTNVPSYYEYRFKGGRNDGYEVTFDGRQITRKLITGGNVTTKTTPWEQGLLILDYNVYHHYQLLLDRYDATKKGKQVFYNYVPLVGDALEVTISRDGEVPLVINQKTIPTVNYTIDFPLNYGADVWATKEGRIVKIRSKQNSIEAVREEYVMTVKKP